MVDLYQRALTGDKQLLPVSLRLCSHTSFIQDEIDEGGIIMSSARPFRIPQTVITGRGAAELVGHCGNDITQGEYVQRSEEMLSDTAGFKRINRLMDNFLTNLSESE